MLSSTKCKAEAYFFFRKFQYTVKYIENHDTYDDDEKDKKL